MDRNIIDRTYNLRHCILKAHIPGLKESSRYPIEQLAGIRILNHTLTLPLGNGWKYCKMKLIGIPFWCSDCEL
jgi:hypothetical protein